MAAEAGRRRAGCDDRPGPRRCGLSRAEDVQQTGQTGAVPGAAVTGPRETGLGAGARGVAMTGSLILKTEFISSLVINYQL